MRLSENRTLAWIVAAVCIIGSVFGLSNASVAGDRQKAVQVFYDGTEKSASTRHSMDRYLDDAAEAASVMAAEASLRLDSVRDTAEEVASLSETVSESEDLNARYEAYTKLKKDADILYNAMYAANLPANQITNFKTAYDDFFGADKFIQKDGYPALAVEFNQNLKGFPANVITGIGGIEPLNTFGA